MAKEDRSEKKSVPDLVIRIDENVSAIKKWIDAREKICEAHLARTLQLERYVWMVLGGSVVVGFFMKLTNIL